MQTKYITITNGEDFDEALLSGAAEVIRGGGLVAFPTETVYGLGADAANPDAAKKIYTAKGRPSDNPLIVHIASYEQLLQIAAVLPIQAKQLSDAFWPGPLTMIVEKNDTIPEATTGGLSTVAVRMPSAKIARVLIEKSGCLIAAPSANLSGRPSPTKCAHVKEDLDGRVDVIIDGGDVPIGLESTIIDLTSEVPTILRPGYITKEQIARVIGDVAMDEGLSADSKEPPKAPGMRYRHYAPKGQLTVVEGDPVSVSFYINRVAMRAELRGEKIGVIATKEHSQNYHIGEMVVLGDREDEDALAAGFYDALRKMDELGCTVIYAESLQTPRLGDALMNRLLKAAGHHVVDASGSGSGDRRTNVRRIIFAAGNGITRAPMAAALFEQIYEGDDIEVLCRGIVVSFPEPLNQKTEAVMISNGFNWEDYASKELANADITDDTH
ncbi:MAG: threonylcarbamoyl-AMP synthase, partial [Lachnospiraceae bacterium]|nr:threonylcarbamoyl-AMP synthase [Lachnospiraceae bacterium]